jgi:hypothetical protein
LRKRAARSAGRKTVTVKGSERFETRQGRGIFTVTTTEKITKDLLQELYLPICKYDNSVISICDHITYITLAVTFQTGTTTTAIFPDKIQRLTVT